MQQLLLNYNNSTIRCHRFGTGSSIVFCFHGYGQQSESFFFLANKPLFQYSFITIDLPYHAGTQWNETDDFDPFHLKKIINQLLIIHFPDSINKKINLMGFSLGGRIALSYFEKNPDQVDRKSVV